MNEVLKPLLGRWISQPAGPGAASLMICRRHFQSFGERGVRLDAHWGVGGTDFHEIAIFGQSERGELAFWSFTSDGKRSIGARTDGRDIHQAAIAFEAMMSAGRARFIYWPGENSNGFYFAAESESETGWNRFMTHLYTPTLAGCAPIGPGMSL